MICPLCQETLQKAVFYGVEIDFCPTCLGLWFEEDELRLAKDEKDKNINWVDIDLWKEKEKFQVSPSFAKASEGKFHQKLCPFDRLPLYEVQYGDSDIKVDVCNLCQGTWLDRGEFKKIIKYLQKRKDYEILHKFSRKLFEEFWEIFLGPETLREEILDFLTLLKLLYYKFSAQHPFILQLISKLPR